VQLNNGTSIGSNQSVARVTAPRTFGLRVAMHY
jgi:hypothetical protein